MADGKKKAGFASGKPGSAQYSLTGGSLKDIYGGKWSGEKKRKVSNRAKTYATYSGTTAAGALAGGAAGVSAGLLSRRVLKPRLAGPAPLVGSIGGYAAGMLAGDMAGAKISHKRGYAKKSMDPSVDKSIGLFARPMTMRRAKAAGRLTRIKADNAVMGAARGAGRTARYLNTNATPLLVGGSIGGGAAVAGMQMNERRKMSKSYVSVSRGAGAGMERLARRSNALRAMSESADPAVAARGRLLSRRMTDGMKRRAAVQAGQAKPRVQKSLPSALRQMSRKAPSTYKAPGTTYAGQRVAASQIGRLNPAAGRGLQASVGGELRAKSRVTLAQQGGRKRLRSPRNAAAMGLNSYRNPLRNV